MSYQSRDRLLGACRPLRHGRRAQGRPGASALPSVRRCGGSAATMRRCLAQMDARSLRDAGISPAAAAYESGKPFWEKMGPLR